MRVRIGWSGETSTNVWQKVDVELEEEDLARVLRDAELPDGLTDKLPSGSCFRLLQNSAETMLLSKLVELGYPSGTAGNRIYELQTANKAIIERLKKWPAGQ